MAGMKVLRMGQVWLIRWHAGNVLSQVGSAAEAIAFPALTQPPLDGCEDKSGNLIITLQDVNDTLIRYQSSDNGLTWTVLP